MSVTGYTSLQQTIIPKSQTIRHLLTRTLKERNTQVSRYSPLKSTDEIAQLIQSYKKGNSPLLSNALFEQAKSSIDSVSTHYYDLPRASAGATRVYLPKELPIVLKHSGSPENIERFEKMQQARDLCNRNGYEKLIIPKARIYKDFIIESRLPIARHNTKEQIGLYIENRKLFTKAIQEFTGFLCQSSLADIIGGGDPYNTLFTTRVGRYDNVPLYLEEGQGKIGFVDLETFSPYDNYEREKEWCFYACNTAVVLFPYHLDEIMSAAQKFDPNIEQYRKYLEQIKDKTLKCFKLVYEDHLEFIREKRITLEHPLAFEKMGLDGTQQLKKAIGKQLLKEQESWDHEKCLGEEPDKTLACFNEKAFPLILEAAYKLIHDKLGRNMRTKEAISSVPELVSIRTLQFVTQNLEGSKFYDLIHNQLESINIDDAHVITSIIIDVIFNELVNMKCIAYYIPRFGTGCNPPRCIFC